MKYENAVKSNLKDAGCSDQSAAFVNQLVQAGRFADAIHEMKVTRKKGIVARWTALTT